MEKEGCPNPSLQLIVVITIISHQTDSALRYSVQIGTKPIVSLEILLTQFATKAFGSLLIKAFTALCRVVPTYNRKLHNQGQVANYWLSLDYAVILVLDYVGI